MTFWQIGKKLIGQYLNPPPLTDQFQANGKLSPTQFMKAGDKLVQVCKGWNWKPSANPKYKSKYLDDDKQYLAFDRCICLTRITDVIGGTQQVVKTEEGDEVTILHPPEPELNSEGKEGQKKQDEARYYFLKIIYDQHYHTPRLFFNATDTDLNPLSNELIRQDITKQYLDKTLTMQSFPFVENLIIPTVHPCKHADVLKSMADTMRGNGVIVKNHFALLIFLKFMASVIPHVEFDMTGQLIFS